MKEFARDVLGGVRRDHQARLDEAFSGGFEEAASICLKVLSTDIDELSSKSKMDGQLSAQERHLLLMLHEIKRETEARLRGFWENESDK